MIIPVTPTVNPKLYNRLSFMEVGRKTRRYHAGLDMHDYQRIDAHSFGVAMLTRILVPEATAERRARLLVAAMDHDLAEQVTGDMPAPAKRDMGIRETMQEYEDKLTAPLGLSHSLNSADTRVLKLADAAEGALHCIAERRMGNQNIEAIFRTFWAYLKELGLANVVAPEQGEDTAYFYIQSEWERAGGKW